MDTTALYDSVARQFDLDRCKGNDGTGLMELEYLEEVQARLPANAQVLDVGCGTGEPLARWFIERGHRVTGVDGAAAMVRICRSRFPWMSWFHRDMRTLDLGRRFDAIVAWDSFFHLTQEDQREMFPVFARHAKPGALLLFTSGPEAGVAMGEIYGHALHHASLDPDEYRALLAANGFRELLFRSKDHDCGGHSVWLAQYLPGEHEGAA